MKLDTFLQSKVRWHLGYNLTSIPAGDQARLEEALNNVQDSFWAVSYTHLRAHETRHQLG